MSKAVQQGSKYTDEQRNEAAIQYAVHGSLTKIEQLTGIPDSTVGTWKDKEWFIEIVGRVRDEKRTEHIATYTQIVDAAQNKALELIPTMTDAKSAMLVACMGSDKSELLSGRPTSINASTAGMADLADKFRQLSRDHAAIQDSVVSTQQSENQSLSESES